MQAFRSLFSWWNEVGLITSLLLCIGYFGSRQALGFLPIVALIAFLVFGLVLCIIFAMRGHKPDEFGLRPEGMNGWYKGIIYVALFILGTALVTAIGAIL